MCEILEDHLDLQEVVRPRSRSLAPMRIPEACRIEVDKAGKEPAIGLVRACTKVGAQGAESPGKLVRGQRHPGDDAERAASAALHEARNPHRGAPAALHITARAADYRLV